MKPPLIYVKQKRSPTLIGIDWNVNLKLHNSEIEPDLLQKCKNAIYKYRDSHFGDTDEHGLPGYQKLQKTKYLWKSVKICVLI